MPDVPNALVTPTRERAIFPVPRVGKRSAGAARRGTAHTGNAARWGARRRGSEPRCPSKAEAAPGAAGGGSVGGGLAARSSGRAVRGGEGAGAGAGTGTGAPRSAPPSAGRWVPGGGPMRRPAPPSGHGQRGGGRLQRGGVGPGGAALTTAAGGGCPPLPCAPRPGGSRGRRRSGAGNSAAMHRVSPGLPAGTGQRRTPGGCARPEPRAERSAAAEIRQRERGAPSPPRGAPRARTSDQDPPAVVRVRRTRFTFVTVFGSCGGRKSPLLLLQKRSRDISFSPFAVLALLVSVLRDPIGFSLCAASNVHFVLFPKHVVQ